MIVSRLRLNLFFAQRCVLAGIMLNTVSVIVSLVRGDASATITSVLGGAALMSGWLALVERNLLDCFDRDQSEPAKAAEVVVAKSVVGGR